MLLNAGAGTASHRGADGLRGDLAAALEALDVSAEFEFCSGPDLKRFAEGALARAQAAEIDAVVVGGGDGSIRTVASVLAGTNVPLGILPLGTLNHFAKDLGIPLHLKEAAQVIAKGKTRAVDLAEVNGETFINNSSIGIYPYIVLDRERRRAHHKLAKWMAMVPALFRVLKHFRAASSRSRRKAGRGPTARRACLSAIMNTAWSFLSLAGGIIWIAASSRSMWSSSAARSASSG